MRDFIFIFSGKCPLLTIYNTFLLTPDGTEASQLRQAFHRVSFNVTYIKNLVKIIHQISTWKFKFSLTLKVPMSCMPDMTPTSLVVAVAPRTGKIIKNCLCVFLKEICYKIVATFCI